MTKLSPECSQCPELILCPKEACAPPYSQPHRERVTSCRSERFFRKKVHFNLHFQLCYECLHMERFSITTVWRENCEGQGWSTWLVHVWVSSEMKCWSHVNKHKPPPQREMGCRGRQTESRKPRRKPDWLGHKSWGKQFADPLSFLLFVPFFLTFLLQMPSCKIEHNPKSHFEEAWSNWGIPGRDTQEFRTAVLPCLSTANYITGGLARASLDLGFTRCKQSASMGSFLNHCPGSPKTEELSGYKIWTDYLFAQGDSVSPPASTFYFSYHALIKLLS